MPLRVSRMLLAIPALLLAGVSESPAAVTTAVETAFFEKNIRPLLVEHCYECHSVESGRSKGGLLLDHRAGWAQGGDSGPAIRPGDQDASLLVRAVRYETEDMEMPPKGRLNDREIALLEQWVQTGAHDPRAEPPSDGTGEKDQITIEEGRRHWAFKPLKKVALPANDAKHPIDAFILATLNANDLSLSPPAAPGTLIRRLSYDLTGLPPSPEAVADFVTAADKDPEDATLSLIDKLLSSPQYGERWGRHWLDVARYADSNGLDENLAFGTAWRYRDYVIEAFNRDLPFNRFVTEQIAGDLLPAGSVQTRSRQRTATAFLNLGAKVLAEPDKEKLQMDIIDEQIDTTGRAFLAMTMGCARCHDHKFDPIKQTDYYAMAAIFKGTRSLSEGRRGAISQWYESPLGSLEDFGDIIADEKQLEAKKAELKAAENAVMRGLRETSQGKTLKYLLAALELPRAPTPSETKRVALKHNVSWPILLNCRIYLANAPADSIFAPWQAACANRDPAEVRRHYAPLIKRASKPADKEDGDDIKAFRAAITSSKGVLALPADYLPLVSKANAKEILRLRDETEFLEAHLPDRPTVISVAEADEVVERLPVHIRGSHLNLGEEVERGFPVVMTKPSIAKRSLPKDQSGRLQLAEWVGSADNPLTARVIVNRIWSWHFGTGLVATPDNFGLLGEKPSHPELLDWLASWFIENGWSVKALHRLILSSQTYQQRSLPLDSQHANEDPENRLLGSFPARRLDAEEIRDSVLAHAGVLDLTSGGKTVPRRNRQFVFNHTSQDSTTYDSPRRAIYLPIIRNNLYDLFMQFDHPDPATSTGLRQTSTVSPQALLMMNSDWVQNAADQFADRLPPGQPEHRLRFAYEQLFGRPPSAEELRQALNFIQLTKSRLASSANPSNDQTLHAWSLLCHALLMSNEFMWLR